jgi:hypothetical protein
VQGLLLVIGLFLLGIVEGLQMCGRPTHAHNVLF